MPRTSLAIYKTCGASGDGSLMYEPSAGDSVSDTCEVMVAIASETAESVTACFNGIELCANPGVSAQSIVEFYTNECARLYRIYLAVADAEHKWSSRGLPSLLEGALSASPEHLMLKNEDAWTKSVETNEDRYGDAVISYAERWARLMEGRIAHGGTVDGCAEETSRIADSEHITAFMYDCAASVLSQFWIHGEELNKWHKLAISPWERSAAKSLATIAPVGGDEKYGTAST